MSVLATLEAPDPIGKADFRRDRWGRPLIVPAGGGKPQPYTRTSGAAKVIEDTFGLEMWARRNVAFGLAHDPSLVARIVALGGTPHTWDADDKKVASKVCEDAATIAQAHKGADIGTAVHRIVERWLLGEDVAAGPWAADLEAFQRAFNDMGWKVAPEHVECRLVCDELAMAGTADMIVADGDRHAIADLKTGSSVTYGGLGYAAQLAAYARSTLYDPATDTRLPTPEIDASVGYIIHLPAGTGTCSIYTADLTNGYRAATLANEVRAIRKEAKSWLVEHDIPRAATPTPADAVAEFNTTPHEGGTIDNGAYTALQGAYNALDAAGREWFRQVTIEAQRNGTPIHLKDNATERRAAIVGALVKVADADLEGADEWVRAAVATVLDTDAAHHPSVTLGACVGALTAAEAQQFADLVDDVIAARATAETTEAGHLRFVRAA